MKKLLIIGNGFDLAHGLKTSYGDFMQKCINENLVKDNKLFNILSHRYLDRNWCDIENDYFKLLFNYNSRELINRHFGEINEVYDSVKTLNDEFAQIKTELEKYLAEEQLKFNELEAYRFLFQTYNSKDTLVLNFNYTNTVSKYLEKFPQINCIHIHGEINNPYNPIIFGFAAGDEEAKELFSRNDNELFRNIKRNNYNKTNNKESFEKWLYNRDKYILTIILGHSCGISDKHILYEIFNNKYVDIILPMYYLNSEGYFQTSTSIERIIGDYNKTQSENKSLIKVLNKNRCFTMAQFDSSNEDIDSFKAFIFSTNSLTERNEFRAY